MPIVAAHGCRHELLLVRLRLCVVRVEQACTMIVMGKMRKMTMVAGLSVVFVFVFVGRKVVLFPGRFRDSCSLGATGLLGVTSIHAGYGRLLVLTFRHHVCIVLAAFAASFLALRYVTTRCTTRYNSLACPYRCVLVVAGCWLLLLLLLFLFLLQLRAVMRIAVPLWLALPLCVFTQRADFRSSVQAGFGRDAFSFANAPRKGTYVQFVKECALWARRMLDWVMGKSGRSVFWYDCDCDCD